MITDEAKVNEEYSESDDDNEIESKVIETIEEHDEPNPTLVKFNSDLNEWINTLSSSPKGRSTEHLLDLCDKELTLDDIPEEEDKRNSISGTKKPKLSLPIKKELQELEQEAKNLTNTIEISNFYDYTKSCMKIIAEIQKTKEKYPKPKKVELKNIDLKKKLAVFDLDETLIHCVVKDYKDCKNIIKITMPSTNHVATIGVNIRPNWEEDIKRISLLYNIVIYTASHQSYADAVLNFLDSDKKYFYNRLYRNNCYDVIYDNSHIYIKDMSIFENYFNQKDVVLIDNSVIAFAFDLDNGIPILPYYDAKNDVELMFCVYYLERIADCEDLREQNKKLLKMEHYLKKAEEEIQKEKKQKNKFITRTARRTRTEKRDKKDFCQSFKFDLQCLRNTFSHDSSDDNL